MLRDQPGSPIFSLRFKIGEPGKLWRLANILFSRFLFPQGTYHHPLVELFLPPTGYLPSKPSNYSHCYFN